MKRKIVNRTGVHETGALKLVCALSFGRFRYNGQTITYTV